MQAYRRVTAQEKQRGLLKLSIPIFRTENLPACDSAIFASKVFFAYKINHKTMLFKHTTSFDIGFLLWLVGDVYRYRKDLGELFLENMFQWWP